MRTSSFWDDLKSLWSKITEKFLVLLVFWIVIVVSGIYFFGTHILIPAKFEAEVKDWIAFSSFATTLVVALTVWLNFPNIKRRQEAEFLLRVDEKWDTPENIKARSILHELFLKCRQNCGCAAGASCCSSKDAEGCCCVHSTHSRLVAQVGEEIIKLKYLNEKDDAGVNKFVVLMTLLDFMETIGFLCREEHVSAYKLDALCGESLRAIYMVFEPYIRHEREKRLNKNLFSEFEFLYNQLKGIC